MAGIGGNRERLIRTFMNRNKSNRRPDKAGRVNTGFPSPTGKASFRPQKQGTVASYKPSKRAKY
jgi:hypothetical protein